MALEASINRYLGELGIYVSTLFLVGNEVSKRGH